MRAMSVSRVTGHRPLCTVRPRAASWLRTSAPACSVTAAARCARLYSSGEQFTVYHDANCVISNSVVESLVSADAPYTTMSFLKKSPKEDTLRQVARVLEGGAELMLQDNSWPRVTDPNEIANVCANNPVLMQRPIVVAPDGGSAITVPLAADPSNLLEWVNAQSFTPVSEAAAAQAAAMDDLPATDSFYSNMSDENTAPSLDDEEEDLLPGSVDDAAEALRSMVMQMPESELRSAAEMMELGDLEGLDRDSLETEELREIVLAAISSAVSR